MISAAEAAGQAIDSIMASLHAASRGVVVDSPPGAGKSALVVRAAAALAEADQRVMVIAQTNEQVDDLAVRLAARHPHIAAGRLAASDYAAPPRITSVAQITVATKVDDLAGCAVVIGTGHKWAMISSSSHWPWAIIDEAYQMRSDLLLRVAERFDRALFVGDPGQLDPFSAVETERWKGLTWDPMQSAVAVMLRHNPDVMVHTLPVSWRLPASAAPVVSDAFYPFTGFTSATGPGDRAVGFSTRPFGRNPLDQAVESAAAHGWALYELPARHTVRTDAEALQACAALVVRFVQRGAVLQESEQAGVPVPLTPDRIAVGTAHRDQAQAIRAILATGGVPGVTVDTANRLQGREFDITIMLHPLSGRRDATAFHLESGRLCVLASRHRHACVVVARAGIPELLDAHPSTDPVHLNEPVKFPDGWAANQSFLAALSHWKVPAQ
jgi:hypothetical protein